MARVRQVSGMRKFKTLERLIQNGLEDHKRVVFEIEQALAHPRNTVDERTALTSMHQASIAICEQMRAVRTTMQDAFYDRT